MFTPAVLLISRNSGAVRTVEYAGLNTEENRMKTRRNTIQKTLIREALRHLSHPTAEEIYQYIHRIHPRVSRATLYRQLRDLSSGGFLLKVDVPGDAARYDTTTRPHCHGYCRECRRIFDLEVDEHLVNGMKKTVKEDYGFQIEGVKVLFLGLCPKCRVAERECM